MELRHKLIKIVIAIAIVFLLGYHYYASVFTAISTESAEHTDHTEGIETQATFIRNEVAVTYDSAGTIHFLVSSGDKVAKDGAIANVFESDAASAAATRIAEIDEQLEVISEIEGYNNSTVVDLDTINDRINGYLNDFVYSTKDGRFSDVEDSVDDLLTMMTRKQVAAGEQTDFTALKDSLTAEKETLTGQMGTPKGTVRSDSAGYFVSAADGYEKLYTTDDLGVYTAEYLQSAQPEAVGENVIGKIVYDYEWYIAAPVTLSESMYYKIDQTVTVTTDITSSPRITASVCKINLSDTGDSAVIVLRCTEMNSELATVRSGNITIIKEEYSGIRVNVNALRHVDGVTGVYVVSGIEAKFVSVEIIYSNEEYAICEMNTSDTSKLRLYDSIIVKGRNLYDGKIIY